MSAKRYNALGDDWVVRLPPSGCNWCGRERRSHFQQWCSGPGWHLWTPPVREVIKLRMARRRDAENQSRRWR